MQIEFFVYFILMQSIVFHAAQVPQPPGVLKGTHRNTKPGSAAEFLAQILRSRLSRNKSTLLTNVLPPINKK
jgi:hypothetical protein